MYRARQQPAQIQICLQRDYATPMGECVVRVYMMVALPLALHAHATHPSRCEKEGKRDSASFTVFESVRLRRAFAKPHAGALVVQLLLMHLAVQRRAAVSCGSVCR